jgi:hypothetical protein
VIGFCPNAIEERGKVFVLNCTVPRKKEILNHYFGHKAPLYKTAKAGVDQLIEDYFSKMEVAATDAPAAVAAANVTADATGGNVAVNDAVLVDADAIGGNGLSAPWIMWLSPRMKRWQMQMLLQIMPLSMLLWRMMWLAIDKQ